MSRKDVVGSCNMLQEVREGAQRVAEGVAEQCLHLKSVPLDAGNLKKTQNIKSLQISCTKNNFVFRYHK